MKKYGIALCGMLLAVGNVFSFKVDFYGYTKKPIHEDITRDAMYGIALLFPDGTLAEVRPEFVEQVAEANTQNDEKGIEYGQLHFDDSQLINSARHAKLSMQTAVTYQRSDPGVNFDFWWGASGNAVATSMGSAIHTLQDFFAHSTWVETNEQLKAFNVSGINESGWLTGLSEEFIPLPKIGIAPNPFLPELLGAAAGKILIINDDPENNVQDEQIGGCYFDQYNASVKQLSTAYYDYAMSDLPSSQKSQDHGWATDGWMPKYYPKYYKTRLTKVINIGRVETNEEIQWPIGRCVHGGDKKADGSNTSGINKDYEARPGYFKARSAAEQATRELMVHFLNESGALTLLNKEKSCGTVISCDLKLPYWNIDGFGALVGRPVLEVSKYSDVLLGKAKYKFPVHFLKFQRYGLWGIEYEGEPCTIIEDYKNEAYKYFFCSSSHKGAGKLKIYQKALRSVSIYENDNFAIACEKGLLLTDGTCGADISHSPATAYVGQVISFVVDKLNSIIDSVVWWFDDVSQGVVKYKILGKAVTELTFAEPGVHAVKVDLYSGINNIIQSVTGEINVLPIAPAVAEFGPQSVVAGSTNTFVLKGSNLPTNQGFSITFAACTNLSYVSHTSTQHEFTCTMTSGPGTYPVTVRVAGAAEDLATFNVQATEDASVGSGSVTAISPTAVTRTIATDFVLTGTGLTTAGLAATVPGDSKASCTVGAAQATSVAVRCTFYAVGSQQVDIKHNDVSLGGAAVQVQSNVSGVSWASSSTTNSGTVKFGEQVTFTVHGVNLTADATMGFAVEKCGASNTEVGSPGNTTRTFQCLFNNEAGAVAGQMEGVVKDAPSGQVLYGGAARNFLVAVEVPPQASMTIKLPHTGITANQCYQAGSDAFVSCSSEGAIALSGAGKQDGMYANVNAMSYSEVPGYSREVCVKDNVTGLMWEGKTASGARACTNGYTNLGNGAANDASGYVAAVNTQALCGYADWRLPTVEELQTIVNFSKSSSGPSFAPAIDSAWFPNTQLYVYWSASPYADNAANAWGVYFGNGSVYNGSRGYGGYHVRLVRASQ